MSNYYNTQGDIIATTQGDYIGAKNQYSEIINQTMREQAIKDDIALEFNKYLAIDKAKALDAIATRRDIHSTKNLALYLLEQVELYSYMQGNKEGKNEELSEQICLNGITRLELLVPCLSARMARRCYKELGDIYSNELELLLTEILNEDKPRRK